MAKSTKQIREEMKAGCKLQFSDREKLTPASPNKQEPLPSIEEAFGLKRKSIEVESKLETKKPKSDDVNNDLSIRVPKLVGIDWDGTVILGNLYRKLQEKFLLPITNKNLIIVDGKVLDEKDKNKDYDKEGVISATRKMLQDGDIKVWRSDSLKQVAEQLISEGHKVVFPTFNPYYDAIRLILEEEICFSKEQLKNIHVISGSPLEGFASPSCKMEHMRRAGEETGVTNLSNMLLVDDSPNNIEKAAQEGCQTLLVNEPPENWDCIANAVKRMEKEIGGEELKECLQEKTDNHTAIGEVFDYSNNPPNEADNVYADPNQEDTAMVAIGEVVDIAH